MLVPGKRQVLAPGPDEVLVLASVQRHHRQQEHAVLLTHQEPGALLVKILLLDQKANPRTKVLLPEKAEGGIQRTVKVVEATPLEKAAETVVAVTAAVETAAAETAAVETAVAETTAEETAVEETAAAETAAAETAVEETTAAETAVEETAVAETGAEA